MPILLNPLIRTRMQFINASPEGFKPAVTCKVCGQTLYSTDHGGNRQVTYHCSSAEARFWDYDRGSKAQHHAKEHWDESREEIWFRHKEERPSALSLLGG
jgi:hypothetical protein